MEGGSNVVQEERRQHRRLRLRLVISRLGRRLPIPIEKELRTDNISTGGMYFHVPAESSPHKGAQVFFELVVPRGEGCSAPRCCLRGTGRVVRAERAQRATGLGVQFTQPLALDF
jgi:hypothetical protein